LSYSCLHKGLYRDVANEIIEGACGPLLIHTDKTKTKEKEAEERVRQRSADTAEETAIAPGLWELTMHLMFLFRQRAAGA